MSSLDMSQLNGDISNNFSPETSHTASPSQSQSHPSKKRKTGSNSRGVATLTPEQLARKRANDREAQRAIRERTKHTIDQLERKIQDLTAQQPYQELQAVIRQKDAIQAENDEIRRRLASVMSIIQPLIGAQGLTDLATAAQQNVQLGLGPNNAFTPDYESGNLRQSSNQSPNLSSITQSNASPYQPFAQGERSHPAWDGQKDALDHQRENIQRGLELTENGERLSLNFLLDSLGQKTQSQQRYTPAPHSPYPPLGQTLDDNQPIWTMLPRNSTPTCPLDTILLNFLHARRQETQQGTPPTSSAGPAYPSVSSLLNPSGQHRMDALSEIMTSVISKFPHISSLPDQVGTLLLMFLQMRWQIYPTQENYERIPEWFRPRRSQLLTPHPAWIDHIPWPAMRDKVIERSAQYEFSNWFIPFTSGLSTNWPYEPVDVLLSTSEKEEGINPVFERHVMRLENWSVGPKFAEHFPELVETTRIVDQAARGQGSAQS